MENYVSVRKNTIDDIEYKRTKQNFIGLEEANEFLSSNNGYEQFRMKTESNDPI